MFSLTNEDLQVAFLFFHHQRNYKSNCARTLRFFPLKEYIAVQKVKAIKETIIKWASSRNIWKRVFDALNGSYPINIISKSKFYYIYNRPITTRTFKTLMCIWYYNLFECILNFEILFHWIFTTSHFWLNSNHFSSSNQSIHWTYHSIYYKFILGQMVLKDLMGFFMH